MATEKQVTIDANYIINEINSNNTSIDHRGSLIKGDIPLIRSGNDSNIYSTILIVNSTIDGNIGPRKNGIIFSSIDIRDSIITGDVDLSNSAFRGDLIFRDTEFLKNFSSINATFDDLTIYNCTFNGAMDFTRSNITQMATFDKSNFSSGANFGSAKFLGEASFKNCNLTGMIGFQDSLFRAASNFSNSNFSGAVDFSGRQFGKNANFEGCKFDNAYFGFSKFYENACFKDARFINEANFRNATFKGEANLRRVYFLNDTDFSYCIFNSHVDFSNSKFYKNASFMEAEFADEVHAEGGRFGGVLNLNRTTYKRFYIKFDSIDSIKYNETAYNTLITNLRGLGLFEDANNCYYRFMCEKGRETNYNVFYRGKVGDLFTATVYFLAWISFGFGMKPGFPLYWSVGLILGFTLFWYHFYPDTSGGMLEKHSSVRRYETNGNFMRALTLSISIFLSGTKIFIDPPKIPGSLKNSNHLITKAYLAERTLGAAFFLMFFLAISKTLIST